MRQSTYIFGALIIAFIVFITVRGDLTSWLALFHAQGAKSSDSTATGVAASSSSSTSGGGILGSLGSVASIATQALGFLGL